MKLYIGIKKLDCKRFECCRKIKSLFLNDLQKEWAKLDDLKSSAWWMASKKHTPIMPHHPDPSSVQVIDTYEYCSNL
jgi:hypothetical protein